MAVALRIKTVEDQQTLLWGTITSIGDDLNAMRQRRQLVGRQLQLAQRVTHVGGPGARRPR